FGRIYAPEQLACNMLASWILCLFFVCSAALAVDGGQVPLKSFEPEANATRNRKQVAIIGAGIAGAAAAYRLQDHYRSSISIEITVYESAAKIGGRIQQARLGPYEYVDTGAQVFYADDECIQAAIDETGLRQK